MNQNTKKKSLKYLIMINRPIQGSKWENMHRFFSATLSKGCRDRTPSNKVPSDRGPSGRVPRD